MKTGVLELLKEWRANRTWETEKNGAQEAFNRQCAAVQEISRTPGYSEILRFFMESERFAIDRSLSAGGEKMFEAQCEARLCRKFLGFLRSRELAQIEKKDIKEE
jgi:hypothetical protein